MGGNAKKRRMVAATRHAAKEKAANKKAGPTTKVDPNEKQERRTPKEKQEPIVQPAKPVKKWTGKSPLDLLHEHLQREKWARARWKEQDTSQDTFGKPLFSWKVSLYNPKTEERLYFRTCVFTDKLEPNSTTEQTWNSKHEAKHNAALAALIHFFPNQPMHLHIAPEYRPVWHYLKEIQQSKEESKKEREEKIEKKKEREKHFEELEMKNQLTRMNLAMTEKTRTLCNEIFLELDQPTKLSAITIPKKIISSLQSQGFTLEQINECKQFAPISSKQTHAEQEEILFETLMLRLPERELPEKFRPSEGNFEVILPGEKSTPSVSPKNETENIPSDIKFIVECVEQLGFAPQQIVQHMKKTNQFHGTANVIKLGKELYNKHCLFRDEETLSDNSPEESELLREEEAETMSSMFEKDFQKEKIQFRDGLVSVWRIPFDMEGESSTQGTLVVFFPPGSSYPFTEPWIKLEIPSVENLVCQYVIQCLFFAYNEPTSQTIQPDSPNVLMENFSGTQMIYSILLWLQQYSSTIIKVAPNKPISPSPQTSIKQSTKPKIRKPKVTSSFKEYLKAPLPTTEVKQLSEAILSQESENRKNPKLQKMQEIRKKLPAGDFKQKIVDLYNNNDVLVISGETGCGKTTQIPQFLLEHFIDSKQGGYCNMICTQPRRLSAIGVASRVAKERNENMEQPNSLVGYQVRLQKQISESCRLVFCTVGILLRRLQQLAQASHDETFRKQKRNLMNEYLSSLSCIIIDEVHERSIDCDFLLIILKQYMLHRPQQSDRPPLKLILMSATIATDKFLQYFQSKSLHVSSLHIPGFTFPVTQIYLPEIIKTIDYHHPQNPNKKFKQQESLARLQEELPEETEEVLRTLSKLDENKIDYHLLENLISHIIQTDVIHSESPGSILVFLPGLAEISKLRDILQSNRNHVLALHSSVPLDKQQLVFDPPPSGKTKIVLSTNIAETSVTIPDVSFVIDTGKVKQMQYDPSTQISVLQEAFISQSSANQRSGRAGRVKAGKCFKIYTKSFFQKMPQFDTPEIFRVPLHQIYLLTCVFLASEAHVKISKVTRFLSSALEAPAPQQLQEAQDYLIALGALRKIQQDELFLTPLGSHITKLPMDVRMAKLLIFSSILRCVNPILTICAVLSYQSPFMSPIDSRQEAKEIQQKFKRCQSDHITYHIAYEAFLTAKKNGTSRQFCKDHFISLSTMYMITKLRTQFLELLADIGFVSYNKRTKQLNEHSISNEQQFNMKVIQACLCAGLYPNVIKIQPPMKKFTKLAEGGTIEKSVKVQELKFYTADRKRVFLHPSSFNFNESKYTSVWMVYLKLMETSRVFAHDTTMVYPYPLLLFGSNNITINQEKNYLIVDGWMYFEADLRVGIIIRKLRAELDKILEQHINLPSIELDMPLFSLIIKIIQTDGLCQ